MLLVSNLGFIGSPACYRAILEMVEVLCEVEYHHSLDVVLLVVLVQYPTQRSWKVVVP